jgi:hypothetical protein
MLCWVQDDEVLKSPGKREAARLEKERLRQQAKQKKELLERMRNEETAQAASGDVRGYLGRQLQKGL